MRLGELAYTTISRSWSKLVLARTLRDLRRKRSFENEPAWLGEPYLEIVGKLEIGRDFRFISQPVQSHLVVHRGAHLEIGGGVSIGFGSGVACHSHIRIGDHTQLGSYVMVLDSDYHVAGNPGAPAIPEPIYIGRNVRIGSHVTVLRGARIEDDARVAPGSVVSGLIPRGAFVSGVPARDAHERLEDTSVEGISAGVLRLAQQTFRLSHCPNLTDGPDTIARWDSLGALSFLLGLETGFGINLHVDEAARVRSLEDVVQLVQRTLSANASDNVSETRRPGRRHSGIMKRVDPTRVVPSVRRSG